MTTFVIEPISHHSTKKKILVYINLRIA
uniref:Uncharacterized protein n=1 Tax=Arundo donax TaxID=35708 RepID=A0A0A9ARQ8_ARUDO